MVHDLSELNETNQLLITHYQEHEDREADLDDEENSRSSRERRRYTDQIERLEQQLEDLRLEYEIASAELHRLRRDRDDYHDEAKAVEAGLQRQQGEVTQREGVIARLSDKSTRYEATLLISASSWTNSAASVQHYVGKYKSYGPPWRTETLGSKNCE